MAMLSVNGANFYYELHGSGQPLILISGYSADHTAWLTLLEGLSRRFQVLLIDNRGVGQTTDDGRPLSIELMAEDVLTISQTLNLHHPHILGHSMGGSIAQAVAYLAPDQIGKLILLNTAAKWRQALIMSLDASCSMCKQNTGLNLIIDSVITWLFGEAFLSNNQMVNYFKKVLIENPYPQSLEDQRRQIDALAAYDGRDKVTSIRAETLIIHGLEDIASLPSHSEELQALIPHAKNVALRTGHMPMMEAVQELLAAIILFL